MCYILTAIKLQNDEPSKKGILNVLIEQQENNPNGTGSVCFNLQGEPKIDRKMKETPKEMAKKLAKYDILNYHFRTSTSGKISEDNVHFWRKGNWVFCHNGTITGQADEINSDSKNFFENILDKGFLRNNGRINFKKITEYTDEFSFWGRFIIMNLKSKKMYFFGDFEFYVLRKSYLIITSTSTDFKESFNTFGIDFETDNELEVLNKEIEGIFMLDLKKGDFKQIADEFVKWHSRTINTYDDDYPTPTTPKPKQTEPKENVKELYPLLFRDTGEMKGTDELAEQIRKESEIYDVDEFGYTPTEAQIDEFEAYREYKREQKLLEKERKQKLEAWKKTEQNKPQFLPI